MLFQRTRTSYAGRLQGGHKPGKPAQRECWSMPDNTHCSQGRLMEQLVPNPGGRSSPVHPCPIHRIPRPPTRTPAGEHWLFEPNYCSQAQHEGSSTSHLHSEEHYWPSCQPRGSLQPYCPYGLHRANNCQAVSQAHLQDCKSHSHPSKHTLLIRLTRALQVYHHIYPRTLASISSAVSNNSGSQ